MVLWTAVASAAADIPPLILEHLTTSEGLPQGTVMTTLQDSQGFVWLGTEDGLVRYDGHELYRYSFSRNNAAGLPGISVPGQPHPDGRPIGVQIVAPFGHDAIVLEIAQRLEILAPWAGRWPSMALSV